jgi:hypothetical protein
MGKRAYALIARRLRSGLRRYAEGADLSKLLRLPWWIDALLGHDRVAYPLHVVIGDMLNWLDVPPAVAGLEWLKAAAHAGSERALQRVVEGLTATRRRALSEDFDAQIGAAVVRRVTCDGQDVTMRRRQLMALERAGISITAPMVMPGLSDCISESPDRR